LLIAVVGAGTWLGTRETAAQRAQRECDEAAAAHAQSIWSPARQAEVQRALGAAASGLATWDRVAVRMSSAVNAWREVENQTCHLPLQDPSRERVLDCLEGRRTVLQSMSDLLATADQVAADNAVNTILLEVKPPQTCGVSATHHAERLGDTENATALREKLARARIFRSAGKFDEAIDVGYQVADAAEKSGDARVEAEARLVLGSLFAQLHQNPAEATLRRAAMLAERVSDDELRARATIGLVGVYSDFNNLDEAHWASDTADALLERLQRPPLLYGTLLCAQGKLEARKGEQEDALKLFRECFGLLEKILPAEDPQVLNAKLAVGMNLPGDEGAEMIRQVIAKRVDALGADHPEVALGYANLGRKYYGMAECDGDTPPETGSERRTWAEKAHDAFGHEWGIRKKAPRVDLQRSGRSLVAIGDALACLSKKAEGWQSRLDGLEILRTSGAPRGDLGREIETQLEWCTDLKRPKPECDRLKQYKRELDTQ
jgi:tetratricopeptide (TPR) repeat protein